MDERGRRRQGIWFPEESTAETLMPRLNEYEWANRGALKQRMGISNPESV